MKLFLTSRNNLKQEERKNFFYLEIFKWVSCKSILSITGGWEVSSPGTRLNSFSTLIKPRSATNILWETDDWGMIITGAFRLMSIKRRKLFLAKSFMLEAAISAAWTVAALRASLADWKWFRKFYGTKRRNVIVTKNSVSRKPGLWKYLSGPIKIKENELLPVFRSKTASPLSKADSTKTNVTSHQKTRHWWQVIRSTKMFRMGFKQDIISARQRSLWAYFFQHHYFESKLISRTIPQHGLEETLWESKTSSCELLSK